jgi:transposase-like protein
MALGPLPDPEEVLPADPAVLGSGAAPVRLEPAPLRAESTKVVDDLPATNTRPPVHRKIYAETEDKIIQLLESGASISLAAKGVGLNRSYLHRYISQNEEFKDRVKQAREIVDDAVEAELFQVAIGKKQLTGKGSSSQIVAMIFWLKNRRPAEWRETRDLTLRPGEGEKGAAQFVLPGGEVLPAASSGLSVARSNKPSEG